MNYAKFLASAGAILLATSALTTAASAQVVYNGRVVTSSKPQVSSTYSGGQTFYQAGSYSPNYQKEGAFPGYVISSQAAPIPQALPQAVPMPAYAPAVSSLPSYAQPAPVYAPAAVAPTYGAVAGAAGYAVGAATTVATMDYSASQVMAPDYVAAGTVVGVSAANAVVHHTHEYMDHDHSYVEHSHGYKEHSHSGDAPEAVFMDAESALAEEVIVEVTTEGYEDPDLAEIPEMVDIPTYEDPSYEEASYSNVDKTVIVNSAPYHGGPTKENALRLSVGYGQASTGNFTYGIQGAHTATSTDTSTWSMSGSSILNGTPWIDEDLEHRGIYGSVRADMGSLFFDVAGGSYAFPENYTVTQSYNLAEAFADSAVLVGPTLLGVDGSVAAFSGLFAYATGDGIEGDDFDKLDVTATINSTVNDFGGAAGYLFNVSGMPLKFGVGVAGKSISRTTEADIKGTLMEATTGELSSASFLDHTYNETVSGTYIGPAVRVNFDPKVNSAISAHFGGTLQALYGESQLTASQTYSGGSYEFEAKDSGMLISGELDAGLSFAVSPNMRLGMGVFAGMTSGAPVVATALDATATEAEQRTPTLDRGTWQNYGLKGSISASF